MTTIAEAPARHAYPIPTPAGILTVTFRREEPTGPAQVIISSERLLINNVEVEVEFSTALPLDDNSRRPWATVRRARRRGHYGGGSNDVPQKTQEKARALVFDALRDVTAKRVTPDIDAAADAGFRDVCAGSLEWVDQRGYDHERDAVVESLRKWAETLTDVDMKRRAVAGLPLAEVQRTASNLREGLAANLEGLLEEALSDDPRPWSHRRR